MKIQVVSDLHLEFSDEYIKNTKGADVLILGGDIMLAEKVLRPESELGVRFRDFLKRCSFQFPHTQSTSPAIMSSTAATGARAWTAFVQPVASTTTSTSLSVI